MTASSPGTVPRSSTARRRSGFLDRKSGAFFSSDCFGAPASSPDLATGADVRAIAEDDLRHGQLLWAAVDSPWVHTVDRSLYESQIASIRALDPAGIFSAHLPSAVGMNEQLLNALSQAPDGPPFVGPDQAALESLLASFEPPGAQPATVGA